MRASEKYCSETIKQSKHQVSSTINNLKHLYNIICFRFKFKDNKNHKEDYCGNYFYPNLQVRIFFVS
ncbi:hypothetical protein Mapa_011829 [Marchantia paleacea]|nr:hypothetical protein Mapa_011829 [Marchantia paleacea]